MFTINIPNFKTGVILDSPLFVTEGRAIIGFPLPSNPSAAPLMKSTCPPNPENIRVPMESEHTWPVRSTLKYLSNKALNTGNMQFLPQ